MRKLKFPFDKRHVLCYDPALFIMINGDEGDEYPGNVDREDGSPIESPSRPLAGERTLRSRCAEARCGLGVPVDRA